MNPLPFALAAALAVASAELVLRRLQDPLARDRTGDLTQLPAATQRLSPRALRGAWRVVVLGDSIPFGWPLATHDGYPSRLEALLAARRPRRPVAVVNCGIGGHTAIMGLARAERDLLRWRPHIALLAFGLNDCHLARTALDARREARMLQSLRPHGRLRAALRRSALLSLVPRLWRPRRPATAQPPVADALPIWREPRVSPAAYTAALRALVGTARRAGARPYLLTMTPLGPAALAGSPVDPPGWDLSVYQAFDRLLRQVAAEERAGLVDLQAAFPAGPGLAPFLAADGLHLTAAGQALVAGAIAEQLSSDR